MREHVDAQEPIMMDWGLGVFSSVETCAYGILRLWQLF
jgi:hypothetical protein